MTSPAITVRGLSKRYTSPLSRQYVQALTGLDLTVEQGEIFGLLGPNGAGKTTLVKILLSIVRATAGTASLYGIPVQETAARRRIGYLPENHRFPGFLTAAQLLDLYGQMAGVSSETSRKRIEELLEVVQMQRWRDTKIKKFSKGMMQRLGLAQALLSDADLIFLDEPTDGVDPLGRREIRDLLLWQQEQGKTIFLNSHLLSEIEQVCTRVAILNEGQLVREGTIGELTTQQRKYEVVCTSIPTEVFELLDAIIEVHSKEDPMSTTSNLVSYHISASDLHELNKVLDRLRESGVLLEAVRPLRRSLESYFIEVVQERKDAVALTENDGLMV